MSLSMDTGTTRCEVGNGPVLHMQVSGWGGLSACWGSIAQDLPSFP